MQASAQQVTGFARDAKGNVYYATSNPGKIFKLSSAARRRRHLHIARPRCADGRRLGHAELARIGAGGLSGRCVHAIGQHRDARRHLERLERPVRGVAAARRSRAPTRATCSGRRCSTGKQASPVLTSVSAAYVQRNLRPKVTSLTVHPAGTVFQKPYPTGDPDIAGFDDQAPDRRILSRTANPGQLLGSLGRRVYQRGLQTFVWRAEDANDDELRYEILYRREGETAWKSLKNETRGSDLRLGHDVGSERHLRGQGRRVGSARRTRPGAALEGELESSAFDIDNGPPAVTVTASRPPTAARRFSSRSATNGRRSRRWNIRSTRSAGRSSIRATASSTRATSSSS